MDDMLYTLPCTKVNRAEDLMKPVLIRIGSVHLTLDLAAYVRMNM